MATANTTPHTAVQQLIQQRLDAIDGALLGLLPRHERQAAVAQVETRIRELMTASFATAADSPAVPEGPTAPDSALTRLATETPAFVPHPQYFGLAPGGGNLATQKKRSRLALAAGVLGILALVLLFGIPVTYFAAELLSEVMGEVAAIALLGAHAVAFALGGAAAVGLGICALVSLKRHREQLAGHGWAISGLCTGALPMLMGGVAALVLGLQFGAGQLISVSAVHVAGDPAPPPRAEPDDRPIAVGNFVPPLYNGEPPDFSQLPVQAAGHEVPTATKPPPHVEANRVLPTPASRGPVPYNAEPSPATEPRPQHERPAVPQSAPQPEPPAEPVPMPESAPVISTINL